MIPLAQITQWRANAPWPDMRHVEQDLIIYRAMCDLFHHPRLKGRIAFRCGTAIDKLLFEQLLRYSEGGYRGLRANRSCCRVGRFRGSPIGSIARRNCLGRRNSKRSIPARSATVP